MTRHELEDLIPEAVDRILCLPCPSSINVRIDRELALHAVLSQAFICSGSDFHQVLFSHVFERGNIQQTASQIFSLLLYDLRTHENQHFRHVRIWVLAHLLTYAPGAPAIDFAEIDADVAVIRNFWMTLAGKFGNIAVHRTWSTKPDCLLAPVLAIE